MVARSTFAASALAIAAQLQAVHAVCFKFGVGPYGNCNVDPRAPEKFQAYMQFNDADATCNDGGIFDSSLEYTDAMGNPKTAKAIASTSVASAASTVANFNFAVANTMIKPSAAATIWITGYNTALAAPFTTSVLYTPQATSSVLYTTKTAEYVAYTTSASVLNLNSVVTRFTTVTPAYLKASTITTDISTSTSQPVASTIINTIIPDKITSTSWAPVSTVTSTYSCDPAATGGARRFEKRKFFEATNSAPFCDVPVTTTIVNGAKTTTRTSTATITNTSLTVATTTNTITAAAAKTKFVGPFTSTSTSILPQHTLTYYRKAKGSTTYVSSTRTKTVWIQPTAYGSGACHATAATPTYNNSAALAVSTSIAQ